MNYKEHIKTNQELFRFWIKRNERLQLSNDILQPLINPFLADNPQVRLQSCQDCIIDMLIWSLIQIKEDGTGTPIPKKKKGRKGSKSDNISNDNGNEDVVGDGLLSD